MSKIKKITKSIKKYGILFTGRQVYFKLWTKYFAYKKLANIQITPEERRLQEQGTFPLMPLFSIVVPLYNTPDNFLREMIDSVTGQTYKNWELCLADGSGKEEQGRIAGILEGYQDKFPNIHYQALAENRGISGNTNACLDMAGGDYIVLFDHDDILHPSALYEVAKEINESGADYVYTDEASFCGSPRRLESIHLKPGFAPDNLRAVNYICHLSVFSRELLLKAGNFREEYDGSQDHDMILRLTEKAENIRHIPKVLYFWRIHHNSVALDINNKSYAIEAGKKAVKEQLQRMGVNAEIESIPEAPSMYNVSYVLQGIKKVTIIQCSSLNDCAGETGMYESEKLIIQWLSCDRDTRWEDIRDEVQGDYVIFLQQGYRLEFHTGNLKSPERDAGKERSWVEEVVSILQREDVGAAGGIVVTPDHKIFQAGFLYDKDYKFGMRTAFAGFPEEDKGYMNRLCFARNVSAIGTGCFGVKKERLKEAQLLIKEIDGASKDAFGKKIESDNQSLFEPSSWWEWSLALRRMRYHNVVTPKVKMVLAASTTKRTKEYSQMYRYLWKDKKRTGVDIKKMQRILPKGDEIYHSSYVQYFLHLYMKWGKIE